MSNTGQFLSEAYFKVSAVLLFLTILLAMVSFTTSFDYFGIEERIADSIDYSLLIYAGSVIIMTLINGQIVKLKTGEYKSEDRKFDWFDLLTQITGIAGVVIFLYFYL